MDRDPGEFETRPGEAPSHGEEDARLDAYIASPPPAPGIRHVDDDDEDVGNVGAASAAGRVYSHAIVGRWSKTAGAPDGKPFREWLADRDG